MAVLLLLGLVDHLYAAFVPFTYAPYTPAGGV
jgi:hypothetical protein